ncbi:GNAT family N-acetyltransferase [Candidatus Enterococcus murrayae]|uniref:GNAT family N-acetyltransferase n=1 Tax=Candidatus Enterococcus murrayae TaxID=2815321 RepID=A0ABS3HN97_9ENTE|nr:GNAT family N-acetyltransferase [Enterococcus sp. MJM16]MBO0454053.1 GNAT family N-acetyltransferase [Enterococcus sp. MJM16]
MKILITKDTMSDIYLDAVRIRQKVFVQEQGVPAKLEIDEKEAYSVHFVLYTDEKKPAATVRLLPLDEQTLKLQRMAVLKEYRGNKLGAEIIKEAEAFASQQGFKAIELGAQLSSEKFYQKLGYTAYGEVFQDAGIDHVHMKKGL